MDNKKLMIIDNILDYIQDELKQNLDFLKNLMKIYG